MIPLLASVSMRARMIFVVLLAMGCLLERASAAGEPERDKVDVLTKLIIAREATLTGMMTRYKDRHPAVVELKAEIEALKQALPKEEKKRAARQALIVSPMLLKSSLTSIRSLLEGPDVMLAANLAAELQREFLSASQEVEHFEFAAAAHVIQVKLAGLSETLRERAEGAGEIRAKLLKSKALVDGLLKLVPDLERFANPEQVIARTDRSQ